MKSITYERYVDLTTRLGEMLGAEQWEIAATLERRFYRVGQGGRRITGVRFVRHSDGHTGRYVEDPLGTDPLPEWHQPFTVDADALTT